jgi:hypothetical protein
MRFAKLLLVCLGPVLLAGLRGNHGWAAAGSANPQLKATVFVDGGDPLPRPPLMADGGAPLPPPLIMVDGGAPLPPPSIMVDGGAPLPPPTATLVEFATVA